MMVRSLARATVTKDEKDRDSDAPATSSVMAALAENIPGDVVAFYTGLFAIVNTTKYGDLLEVRLALLVIGLAATTFHFASERMSEGGGNVTFGSSFQGKPRQALIVLLFTFCIWGFLVMSGKQDPLVNAAALGVGFVWTFMLPRIRKVLRL